MVKKTYSFVCRRCGIPFQAKSKFAIYCGGGCRTMSYKIRQGIPLPEFTPKNIYHKIPTKMETYTADLIRQLAEVEQQIRDAKRDINESELAVSNNKIISIFNDPRYKYEHNLQYPGSHANRDKTLYKAIIDAYEILYDIKNYDEHRKFKSSKEYNFDAEKFRDFIINKAKKEIEELNINSQSTIDELVEKAEKLKESLNQAHKGMRIEHMQDRGKIIDSEEILNIEFPHFDIEGEFAEVMNPKPSKDFLAMLQGSPSSGKSSFAIRFASYFNNHVGKAIYYSLEEGISRTFQSKLERNLKYGNIKVVQEYSALEIYKQSENFDLCVIDSVSHAGFKEDDFNLILQGRRSNPTSFLFIYHETKDGSDYIGKAFAKYDVDIRLKATSGIISVLKNRFYFHESFEDIQLNIFEKEEENEI